MLGVPEGELGDYMPRFNIAPTQPYFVLLTKYESREAMPATWGLVNSWAKDAGRASMCINAKAETVDKLPSFREAFAKRRCVVPADGFYEWSGPRTARQPHWIHRRDGQLLLFAGLYEEWQPAGGDAETTFTILTCAANSTIARVHDRMPVILSDRDADDWMNPRETDPHSLKRMLIPTAEDVLEIKLASPLVNHVRNEGPQLLANSDLLL